MRARGGPAGGPIGQALINVLMAWGVLRAAAAESVLSEETECVLASGSMGSFMAAGDGWGLLPYALAGGKLGATFVIVVVGGGATSS